MTDQIEKAFREWLSLNYPNHFDPEIQDAFDAGAKWQAAQAQPVEVKKESFVVRTEERMKQMEDSPEPAQSQPSREQLFVAMEEFMNLLDAEKGGK